MEANFQTLQDNEFWFPVHIGTTICSKVVCGLQLSPQMCAGSQFQYECLFEWLRWWVNSSPRSSQSCGHNGTVMAAVIAENLSWATAILLGQPWTQGVSTILSPVSIIHRFKWCIPQDISISLSPGHLKKPATSSPKYGFSPKVSDVEWLHLIPSQMLHVWNTSLYTG